MKHPKSVDGIEARELAKRFMSTAYEYHLEFFKELTRLYREESEKDGVRGYKKLSKLLGSTSVLLEKVWKICEPHMGKPSTTFSKKSGAG